MSNTPKDAIVVAVGTEGYDAAVAFAVAEAHRTSRSLHLVHVVEHLASHSYIGNSGILDAARATLDEAKAAALAGNDVVVTAELIDNGWIVDDLVRHTEGASLLVLQHRTPSRDPRIFTGSTV